MQIEELRTLLARVDAANGPDREIDQDLFCDLGLCPRGKDGIFDAYRAPRYTESLDAAVALVETIKPDEAGILIGDAYREMSRFFGWHMAHTRPGQLSRFPLIICAKLLECLIDLESI